VKAGIGVAVVTGRDGATLAATGTEPLTVGAACAGEEALELTGGRAVIAGAARAAAAPAGSD
jgi:hypothetical protein